MFAMTSHGVQARLPLIRPAGHESSYALAVLACQDQSRYVALYLVRLSEFPARWGFECVYLAASDGSFFGTPVSPVSHIDWWGDDALEVEWSEFYISYDSPFERDHTDPAQFYASDSKLPWLPECVLYKLRRYGFVLQAKLEITTYAGQRGYYPFWDYGRSSHEKLGQDLDVILRFDRRQTGASLQYSREAFWIYLRLRVSSIGHISHFDSSRY
jgi:hypothetical protein